jgi:hypothetical protein
MLSELVGTGFSHFPLQDARYHKHCSVKDKRGDSGWSRGGSDVISPTSMHIDPVSSGPLSHLDSVYEIQMEWGPELIERRLSVVGRPKGKA